MNAKQGRAWFVRPATFTPTVSRIHWLALTLVLGFALLIRLLWLDADAALTLSWSGAPFTDEGLYSHAARNRALFGVWRISEWDNRLVSPLHDGLAYVVFRVLGVGYVQLRLISVMFTIASLGLFWSLLRYDFGAGWATFGTALWGLDYFWFQFSRLGLLEPGMVAWLVLAAWCWRRAIDGSSGWSFVCGAAVALAWIWKSLALLFIPAPLIALLLIPSSSSRWRFATVYLFGLGVVLFLYSLLWFWPHQNELAAYQRFYATDRLPDSLPDLLRTLWQNVRSRYVWAQTPILLGAAIIGAARCLFIVRAQKLPPIAALAFAWAVCGSVLLIMPYSPPRYYTLLVPPVVCLALIAVRFTDNQIYPKTILPPLLLTACLLWSGTWYMRWTNERRSTLMDSSRALQRLVPSGEVVLGVSACGLSLENEMRCVPPFVGLANEHEPVQRFRAQYALVEHNPSDYMRRFYGPLLADSTPLTTLPFGRGRVTLYRLATSDD